MLLGLMGTVIKPGRPLCPLPLVVTNLSEEKNVQPAGKRGKTRLWQVTTGLDLVRDWLKYSLASFPV